MYPVGQNLTAATVLLVGLVLFLLRSRHQARAATAGLDGR